MTGPKLGFGFSAGSGTINLGKIDQKRLPSALMAGLVTFVIIAFSPRILSDPDSWWHLATGRWIVENAQIPRGDPFSFSRPGASWHPHEWLSEILMWAAWVVGGANAVITLASLSAAAAIGMLCYFIQRPMKPSLALLLSINATIFLVPSAVARPHILVLPIAMIWIICLSRAREKHGAPPLILAVLMTLWANMHGSFMLGLLIIGPFALEALWEEHDRWAQFRKWALFSVVAFLASLVTPFGINGFIYPFYVSGMETLRNIDEWRATTPANSPLFFVALAILVVGLIRVRPKMGLFRGGLFLFLLFMALYYQRNQFLFGLLGTAIAFSIPGKTGQEAWNSQFGEAGDPSPKLLWGLALAGLGVIALRLFFPSANDDYGQPFTAIAHIPLAYRDQPVFNHYNFGGPLIFDHIRPYIDGRADMYGDALVKDYMAVESGNADAWVKVQAKYGMTWVMIPPDSPMISVMKKAQWPIAYRDDKAVIFIAPNQGVKP